MEGYDENGRRIRKARQENGDEDNGEEEEEEGEKEAPPPVWAGKKVLLTRSLGLNAGTRASIEERVRSGGGIPVRIEPRNGSTGEEDGDEEMNESRRETLLRRWAQIRDLVKATIKRLEDE